MECVQCGKPLGRDDIGLHKKLINRGAEEDFLCIDCLCAFFKISRERAEELIAHYREMGCTLFP